LGGHSLFEQGVLRQRSAQFCGKLRAEHCPMGLFATKLAL
jgi:hypothetical protein